jgi:5-methylcytosine-specific restriction enzyme A
MPRSTKEWIGKTPDTPFPSRVRVRIFDRDGGRCQCGCSRLIRPGESWQTDHRIALINGGQNRESNGCTLLTEHHKVKTGADLAEKSAVYARRSRHVGAKRKAKGRPLLGTVASGIRKPFNGPPVYRDTGKPVGRRT